MYGFGDANNGQHSCTTDEEHTREVVKKHFKSVFLSKYAKFMKNVATRSLNLT